MVGLSCFELHAGSIVEVKQIDLHFSKVLIDFGGGIVDWRHKSDLDCFDEIIEVVDNPNSQIYCVQATSGGILGHATGNIRDIRLYFENRTGYSVRVNPIQVINVSEFYSTKSEKLLAEIRELEKEKKRLLEELQNLK